MANGIAQGIFLVLQAYDKAYSIDDVPIEIDRLRPIIQDRCELKTISWEAVPVEAENVYGYVKFYYPVPSAIRIAEEPTTANIRFKQSLDYEWQRFVICKEMCHCMIDTDADRVSNVADLKKLLEELAARLGPNPKVWPPMQTEKWAEVMALELLFPYELRRQHFADYRANRVKIGQIADRYKIPTTVATIGMYDTYNDSILLLREGVFLRP